MKRLTALIAVLFILCLAFPCASLAADTNTFWLTHYNNATVEGSGVIFTEPYTGAAWWYHAAFAPVSGAENVYEITAISNGWSDGSGTPLDIPTGGFVWATNAGNNYPVINPDDSTAINYTSDACNNMYTLAKEWAVGDKFVFTGLDLVNLTVPTDTADKMWYDPAYVCTATFAAYSGGSTESEPASESADESVSESESSAESAAESASEAVSETASEAASASSESSEAAANNGVSSWVWIGCAAAVVIIAVVIILVVNKKKK